MWLAWIAASAAADITLEGNPDGYIATVGGAVLSTEQFMLAVGDDASLSAYRQHQAMARRRASTAWIAGPIISGVGTVGFVWAYQEYEPPVSAASAFLMFGGGMYAVGGTARYLVRNRQLADVDSWYTYEQATRLVSGVDVPGGAQGLPGVELAVPLTVSESLVAMQGDRALRPDEFAWEIGDFKTWRQIRVRRGANAGVGSVLTLAGIAGFALAAVADEDIAMLPAAVGVVGLVGGGVTLTVGRQKFQELDRWYEPDELAPYQGHTSD